MKPARCGLVSRTCPAGSLHALTSRVLEESIRPRSAAALRQAVRASRHARFGNLREELGRLERVYLDELMATRDANEGIAAFLEKREPVWSDS